MVDAMILAAAYANGGCEHALDITVEYSKDRYQFGKALAEFQALSHNMADAKTALDGHWRGISVVASRSVAS